MKATSIEFQSASPDVGVYDCEVRLKFRLIEEKGALRDREKLLEMLLDAFSCGADEYLEMLQVHAAAEEISEMQA
ncbi:MAG TPA: Npun_R1517 family heterocyst differentiation transcriptional regulator, partial [Chroococcidiopsis sp.]